MSVLDVKLKLKGEEEADVVCNCPAIAIPRAGCSGDAVFGEVELGRLKSGLADDVEG